MKKGKERDSSTRLAPKDIVRVGLKIRKYEASRGPIVIRTAPKKKKKKETYTTACKFFFRYTEFADKRALSLSEARRSRNIALRPARSINFTANIEKNTPPRRALLRADATRSYYRCAGRFQSKHAIKIASIEN